MAARTAAAAAADAKRWARDAAKSTAVRAVVDNLVANRKCVPDKDNAPLTMALFQQALDKCGGNHQGLLLDVPQLMDAVRAAAGIVTRVIFVGAGMGHAEHALAALMKRIAAADPVRYSGLQDFEVILTDGVVGPEAPPVAAWWHEVKPISAEEAVRRHGNTETVVMWIKPPPENPARPAPTNLVDAMQAVGIPAFFAFMEQPTAGFDPEELKAAVKAHRDAEDGKPIAVQHIVAVTSYVIDDDGQPKSDMDRTTWQELNSRFVRFKMLPGHVQLIPRWQSSKTMAWIGFAPRPLANTETPLPKLKGKALAAMVARYATLVK